MQPLNVDKSEKTIKHKLAPNIVQMINMVISNEYRLQISINKVFDLFLNE